MQLVPSAHESLAQIVWQRFGIALFFGPLFALANQVGIDTSLVCQVVRYDAVDLFEAKKLEVLTDGLRRLATAKCMDNRIQRDPRARNISAVAARCIPLPSFLDSTPSCTLQ